MSTENELQALKKYINDLKKEIQSLRAQVNQLHLQIQAQDVIVDGEKIEKKSITDLINLLPDQYKE
jgi:prefoldin subunit 5